jgi:inner membrane protein
LNRIALIAKFVVAGLLALLLFVPLVAISGLTAERQSSSQQVLADIQRLGVGEQRILGPILVIPYRKTVVSKTADSRGVSTDVSTTTSGQLHFLPSGLTIESDVTTETRYRGIYSALFYTARQKISGTIVVPEKLGVEPAPNESYTFSAGRLILAIGDTRGIKGTPSLQWGTAAAEWKGGTETEAFSNGLRAEIGTVEPGTYQYAMNLDLQGTQALEYVPVGKQTDVAIKSDWPHPSFSGQFLPESRTIDATGFNAQWHTSHLASNVESAMRSCFEGKCDVAANAVGVGFIQPVNVYLKSERAVKYGFLFIVITFVSFQLFELLKGLAIHPVQYGLVGFALALFFLLLLALTEHVPFALAYAIASVSCVGLLAFYVSHVLRSVRRASGFTAMLVSLYGALYVLLVAEDLALLLGALLLFAILATVMIVTRRVDWYQVGTPPVASDVS